MARFASLLFETPGGSLPPYILPPSHPLNSCRAHTHIWIPPLRMRPGFWGLAAAAAQHPLLNQVVMGMVAGGVQDIFIYICVPAAFRSPYS